MRTLQRAPRTLLVLLSFCFVTVAACKDGDDGDDKADDADAGDGDGDSGDGDSGDGDADDWGDGDSGDGDSGDGDPSGDGDGDTDPDPTGSSGGECCSLFDCPGTEVMCECGKISGCFITEGECGRCITQADCAAYCANSAPPAPFSVMTIE